MAEQKQGSTRTLPKNIRQIGTSSGTSRVYLEDYVYTYLHAQEELDAWTYRGFVLLGKIERGKDFARYFISGLIRVEDEFFKDCMRSEEHTSELQSLHAGIWRRDMGIYL